MNVSTAVRPLTRVLSAAAVTALAAGCIVSGATGRQAVDHAATSPHTVAVRPGGAGAAKKESAPFRLEAQQASPAMRVSSYQHRVVVAINRVRKRHHLHTLTRATCTQTVASRWSRRLAAHDAFHHQSMPALLKRCDAHYVGETLARGSVTPNRMVRMWLDSPPHRHILLSRSPRRIGLGATPDAHGQWVAVGEFMRF